MSDDHDIPSPRSSPDSAVLCWQCPLCHNVYKRRYHFDHHLESIHHLGPEEVSSTWRIELSKDEFEEKQHQAVIIGKSIKEEEALGSGMQNKSLNSKWGPKAFSSSFSCCFCEESFTKGENLMMHIKKIHKEQPKERVSEALVEISQFKLDGCVYQCNICSRKFDTSTSFLRHARDMHNLTLKQYYSEHGSAETVSGVFSCKLCNKSIKHTRNIITSHMKLVHHISWLDYMQTVQNCPNALAPEVSLFECAICTSKVKYKKQHLNKAHQMDEDVYEAFLMKDPLTTEIFGTTECKICKRLSMDMGKHIQFSHKMTLGEYEVAETVEETSLAADPTKLMCYFKCNEVFKKEIHLMTHIELKHSDEDYERLRMAKTAAVEEIALKRSSAFILCEICDITLSGRSSFWTHVTRKHKMKFKDYESQFGKVGKDSNPFNCKLCPKVLKFERGNINLHLQNIHGMTWSQYLTTEKSQPGAKPVISEKIKCKLCDLSVTGLRGHLKNIHLMTETDYQNIEAVEQQEICGERHNISITSNAELRPAFPPYPVSDPYDVTNKYNKSCRKCQLDFPTRKMLIVHCQIVHGMKFELKTGEKIPLPPVDAGLLQ